jgi:hypothetical protein
MRLQAWADRVAFTDVKHLALAILTRPEQQIHTRLQELSSLLHLGQQRPWEHQRFTVPIGAIDHAQTVWVAVDHKNA